MPSRPGPPTDLAPTAPVSPARLVAVTAVVLVAFNVARGLGAFGRWNDLAAVGLAAVLIGVAALGGAGADTLGLAREHLGRGLVVGLAALAVVAVAVVVAALVPATSGFLDDDRVDVPFASMVWQVGFVVVVATAIPEELAFRGLLLGAGREAWGPWTAALVSSALFGLWHISPTLATMHDNATTADVATSPAGQVALVVGSVAVTFVAGLVFSALRLWSGSLVAPVIAHVATNGIAFVVAWLAAR